MFQAIECDNTVKNPLICDYDNLNQYGYNENDFKVGNKIKKWSSNIFFQATKKKMMVFLMMCYKIT